jgi:serine/threonine protein kinase
MYPVINPQLISAGCWDRRECGTLLFWPAPGRDGKIPTLIIHIQGRQNNFEPQDFIHREGVCHRDLKPENILLDAAGTLKISDFGLAAVYKLKESGKTRQLDGLCGSLPYMAPEVCYIYKFSGCTHSMIPGSLPNTV